MELGKIIAWLDGVLKPSNFDDVSNNGLQIARSGGPVRKVAFAVDGSAKSVRAAAAAGAQLLVVHHGISWGGGIRRITDGTYSVVKTAMDSDLALYASHLPLDASRRCGNNWEIARALGLSAVRPAFSYHGNVIGVTGRFAGGSAALAEKLSAALGVGESGLGAVRSLPADSRSLKLGVCSGGAGAFAADAKALGCDLYVTGEADWGEVIAAENIGMPVVCAGHYQTETFGVRALMREMKKALKVATTFVCLALSLSAGAADEEEDAVPAWYVGGGAQLVLPQGGSKMRRLGGGALRAGRYVTDWAAAEFEAAWLEDRCGLAVRGVLHWRGCDEYDKLFGFSRFDPFFTAGVRGWMNDGQVGPAAGVGALYYLTDEWALRGDAEATLGLDTDVEMVYALALGVQYSF